MTTLVWLSLLLTGLPQETGDPLAKAFVSETCSKLVKLQQEDGSWKAPEKTDEQLGDAGMTALAMLVLMSEGSHTRFGPYQKELKRALDHLLGKVGEKGQTPGNMADHALVTMVTCELEVLQPGCAGPGKRRPTQMIRALLGQQGEDGGFGSPEDDRIFLSILGYHAICGATNADLPIDLDASRLAARTFLLKMVRLEDLAPTGESETLGQVGIQAAAFIACSTQLRTHREKELVKDLRPRLADILNGAEFPSGHARAGWLLSWSMARTAVELPDPSWKTLITSQDRWLENRRSDPDPVTRLYNTLGIQARLRFERVREWKKKQEASEGTKEEGE